MDYQNLLIVFKLKSGDQNLSVTSKEICKIYNFILIFVDMIILFSAKNENNLIYIYMS